MESPQTFGEFLRACRVLVGATQEELARRAGLSVRGLRELERDRVVRPRVPAVRRLAAALELSDANRDRLLALASGVARVPYVGVLGPLLVRWGDVPVEPGAPTVRRLLGLLAIQPGQLVSVDEIIEVLWGDRPPRTCLAMVRTHASRLRRLVGMVTPAGKGYRVTAASDQLDVVRFDALASDAERAEAAGDHSSSASLFEAALRCWRGPVLSDLGPALTQHPAAVATRRRRVRAALLFADIVAGLGRHEQAAAVLPGVAADEPFDEALHARLILALAGTGQRASAVRLFTRLRDRLGEELGVEPGTELRAAYLQVLGSNTSTSEQASVVAPARMVPAQLPADVAGLVSRQRQLEWLDALLSGGSGAPVPVIATIAGMAGVGKTALAVHWAHRVKEEFPDGQLYVNLHGHAAGAPLRPDDALAAFLSALGVPAEQVPADLDQAAALYRSLLAGSRTLVLLDDANHPDQVRPLLPGSPGCLVVITSRDQFRGLVVRNGAVRLDLDLLTTAAATALLTGLIGTDRARTEPQAIADLAALCGGLPLALRIAAANVSAHPLRPIADQVAELATGDHLTALEVPGDTHTTVRFALDHSFAALPRAARRLFGLAGLLPCRDITAQTTAACAGLRPAKAGQLLDQLASVHLIEEHTPGRYTMHDLIRRYAAERARTERDPADREAAVGRLLDHYLDTAATAARQLYPDTVRLPCAPTVTERVVADFAGQAEALAWLDTERANLLSAAQHAAEHGPCQTAWLLADVLRGYFTMRPHVGDWQALATAGLAAAQTEGDLRAQAGCRIGLAALGLLRGRHQQAIAHSTRAITLAHETGWRQGQAVALGFLGTEYASLGELPRAADHWSQALTIHRETGWRPGQVAMLAKIGQFHHVQGHLDEAVAALVEAGALQEESDARESAADATRALAAVYRDTGQHAKALDLGRAAVSLATEISHERLIAYSLNTLASIHHHLGRPRQAVNGYRRALDLARTVRSRYAQTQALTGLAVANQHAGQLDEAIEQVEAALVIARRTDYRLLESDALTVLAAVHLSRGQHDKAAEHASHALAMHTETGNRLGEARTHLIAARALRGLGHNEGARIHHNRANELFAETGTPPDIHVRAVIGAANA